MMSPQLREQYKALCEYLKSIKNKEDRRMVFYDHYDEITVKNISFVGNFTEYKSKHCKQFDRYSFNCYTEEHDNGIKYYGQGLFKIITKRG